MKLKRRNVPFRLELGFFRFSYKHEHRETHKSSERPMVVSRDALVRIRYNMDLVTFWYAFTTVMNQPSSARIDVNLKCFC